MQILKRTKKYNTKDYCFGDLVLIKKIFKYTPEDDIILNPHSAVFEKPEEVKIIIPNIIYSPYQLGGGIFSDMHKRMEFYCLTMDKYYHASSRLAAVRIGAEMIDTLDIRISDFLGVQRLTRDEMLELSETIINNIAYPEVKKLVLNQPFYANQRRY